MREAVSDEEEEDDFECYFLRPVNEYVISEKIKQANKDLFDSSQPNSPAEFERKVTFRKNLEDFVEKNDTINHASCDNNDIKIDKLVQISEEDERKNFQEICDDDIEEISEEIVELKLEEPIKNLHGENVDPKEITNDIQEEINQFEEIKNSSSEDDLSVLVASYIDEEYEKMLDSYRLDTPTTNKSIVNRKKKFFKRKKTTKDINAEEKTFRGTSADIKFNHRICCEYRNAKERNEKLPKYTGYLSQYGLTKEQWEDREKRCDKQKVVVLEKNLKATETKLSKMEDNERAFTKWLKIKMRFPTNRTKNMFDFKQAPSSSRTKTKNKKIIKNITVT